MKIDNTGNVTGVFAPQSKRTPRRTESEDVASQTAPAKSETVAISSRTSQAIAADQQISASVQPFDAKKVEEIRNALLSGDYQPDSSKTADGLIQHLRGLL
ncbi:flagellar biosynthesis anti-sigma factor FlgM [Paludibacterium paludis]|uniref:Negative regulator of flagellin synthesis n=1 Tax=Paludibacterium paludis TaxID=1225769 RepID=A0A918NWD1_9NEIS|nr:flagellar biosynthesis anti-sigma factor FlgM [Paludibacterium paludis]GGY02178.1 hypothetical protein GCM10011289_00300 [Paludibacterium paludis]